MKTTKRVFRDALASLLWKTGITRPNRRGDQKLSIATFHRILPAHLQMSYPFPGLCLTPEELDWVLCYLRAHYSCGTLQESAALHNSAHDTDRPLLAITFDDAQVDNHIYAQPVLAKHGLRASFFAPAMNIESGESLWHDKLSYAAISALDQNRSAVGAILGTPLPSTESAFSVARSVVSMAKSQDPIALDDLFDRLSRIANCGKTNLPRCPKWAGMMGWGNLKELQNSGHEIGSHSLTHSILTHVDDEQLQREIGESKQMIENNLDQEITSFCFPNGDHDARCLKMLEEHGYKQACTTSWGRNDLHAPPFTLRRFDITSDHMRTTGGSLSKEILAWRMSGLYPGLPS